MFLLKKSFIFRRFSTSRNSFSLGEAFEIIARKRYSEKKFADEPVDRQTLEKILKITQLAPSSLNLQPYRMVIVQSEEAKSSLVSAMIGHNQVKVKDAPVSVVFASMKDPNQHTRKVMKMELENGKDPAYVSSLPAKASFLVSSGWAAKKIFSLGTHLLSPLQPTPNLTGSNVAWSMKNTSFAAQQFMLAATAFGLSTAPMEGFDERRVCSALNIPLEEYSIPVIISLGYGATEEKNEDGLPLDQRSFKSKARFELKDICYQDKFGEKMK